jgi:hypothetical protein
VSTASPQEMQARSPRASTVRPPLPPFPRFPRLPGITNTPEACREGERGSASAHGEPQGLLAVRNEHLATFCVGADSRTSAR